jgi:hypothetical protein
MATLDITKQQTQQQQQHKCGRPFNNFTLGELAFACVCFLAKKKSQRSVKNKRRISNPRVKTRNRQKNWKKLK